MIVSFMKKLVDEDTDYGTITQITGVDFCCTELKENYYIDTGLSDDYALEVQFQVGYDWENISTHKISFCPFCGEKVIIKEDPTEDLSKLCSKLRKEIENYREKIYKEDSLSKINALEADLKVVKDRYDNLFGTKLSLRSLSSED